MTLRLGVIGTGAIGQDHIHRITYSLKGAEVIAVTDINEERVHDVIRNENIDAKVSKMVTIS